MLKPKRLVPFLAWDSTIISTDIPKNMALFRMGEERYADNALSDIIALKNVHHDTTTPRSMEMSQRASPPLRLGLDKPLNRIKLTFLLLLLLYIGDTLFKNSTHPMLQSWYFDDMYMYMCRFEANSYYPLRKKMQNIQAI